MFIMYFKDSLLSSLLRMLQVKVKETHVFPTHFFHMKSKEAIYSTTFIYHCTLTVMVNIVYIFLSFVRACVIWKPEFCAKEKILLAEYFRYRSDLNLYTAGPFVICAVE